MLIIGEAADLDENVELSKKDPFVKQNIIGQNCLKEWLPK